jgi:hypothetical protein
MKDGFGSRHHEKQKGGSVDTTAAVGVPVAQPSDVRR